MIFGRSAPAAVSLGLQGGGAHGAYTWGVLDALLEDGRVAFDGVSGTSAGAMNAVALAQGLMAGGADGARASLERFWTAVADSVPFPVAKVVDDGRGAVLAPAMRMMMSWTQYLSPEQLNPFDLNPLRDILTAQIDFEQLRQRSPVRLFLAATHANSGRLRLFRTAEIDVSTVLASACLPGIHRSIVIDGQAYWDGGYAANPSVLPLVQECQARDILIVMLAPLRYEEVPQSAREIRNRTLDFAFNTNFLREMRTLARLQRQSRASWLRLGRIERRLAQVHWHVVEESGRMERLDGDSKLAASRPFLTMLKNAGRERAQAWLRAHRRDLGRRDSVDLVALFGEP